MPFVLAERAQQAVPVPGGFPERCQSDCREQSTVQRYNERVAFSCVFKLTVSGSACVFLAVLFILLCLQERSCCDFHQGVCLVLTVNVATVTCRCDNGALLVSRSSPHPNAERPVDVGAVSAEIRRGQ